MARHANIHKPEHRMRWEVRLAGGLVFLVVDVLIVVWCLTRRGHFVDGTYSHTLYGVAAWVAIIAGVCAVMNLIRLVLEKNS